MTRSKCPLSRYGHFTAKLGFFLAQVAGESVNRRIPNDWEGPRNLVFSPSSRKTNIQNGTHSESRNVELQCLSPLTIHPSNLLNLKTHESPAGH